MLEKNKKVLLHKLHNNKYAKSPKGKYFRYRIKAQERGFGFSLNLEEFTHLLGLNCHYCGIEKADGVDRKDSKYGYTKENSLPCCWTCNCMKKTYAYEFFINHINKVVNNLKNI